MQPPDIPPDEQGRLSTLHALDVLDTPPEERFDRITRVTKSLFDVPIVLVSLIDEHRQWFKSRDGLEASETSRDISFCGHAILGDDVYIVADAHEDRRFADNPLVTGDPHMRFYAGCPLKMPNGARVGTLCLIDTRPRSLSKAQVALLEDLAQITTHELLALQLATVDDLTSLPNRRGFQARCQHALSMARRRRNPAALLYFDLDNFKQINDRFGHAEGDHVLVRFADLMRDTFRGADVLGRFGGDEFGAFISAEDTHGIRSAIGRFEQSVRDYNAGCARGYRIEYSVGCASVDEHPDARIAQLLAEADRSMYKAKQAKRASR